MQYFIEMKYILVPEFIHLIDFWFWPLIFSPILPIYKVMQYRIAWGKQEQKIILYVTQEIDAQLFEFQK